MPMDLVAYTVFVLTIVERLIELRVSLSNAAWSFAHGGKEFGASHYKWMVLMHSLFLVAMLLEFAIFGTSLTDGIRLLAVGVAIVCQGFRWWVIRTLGPQWNTRVIIVPGFERVKHGPYRFLNHPNYVVVAIETAVLPLIFGAWRTAVLFSFLNLIMMWVRVRVENEALKGLK